MPVIVTVPARSRENEWLVGILNLVRNMLGHRFLDRDLHWLTLPNARRDLLRRPRDLQHTECQGRRNLVLVDNSVPGPCLLTGTDKNPVRVLGIARWEDRASHHAIVHPGREIPDIAVKLTRSTRGSATPDAL